MNNYNKIQEEYTKCNSDQNLKLNRIKAHLISFEMFQKSEKIKKSESMNRVILLDRWSICQQIYAKAWMAKSNFNSVAFRLCLEPDLTIVVDSELSIIEQRLNDRGSADEFKKMICPERLKRLYLIYESENKNSVLIKNNGILSKALASVVKEYSMREECNFPIK